MHAPESGKRAKFSSHSNLSTGGRSDIAHGAPLLLCWACASLSPIWKCIMFKRFATAFVVTGMLMAQVWANDLQSPTEERQLKPQNGVPTDEFLTDAAIIAIIIAASIAVYRATGHPCACPYDRMRNGRRCGGRSAYSRPGGAKPLCFPSDITAAMIAAYRAKKTIPSLR